MIISKDQWKYPSPSSDFRALFTNPKIYFSYASRQAREAYWYGFLFAMEIMLCARPARSPGENAQNDLNQVNSNLHAGFVIIFDNIDGKLNKRHMTKDNQNYDYHWINHKVAMNRVSGNKFDPSPRNVLDVPNIKLLPTIQDQSRQRYNYIVLVARMLVEHLDSFKMFKDVCVYHIPHKYSREMAMKSETVSTKC